MTGTRGIFIAGAALVALVIGACSAVPATVPGTAGGAGLRGAHSGLTIGAPSDAGAASGANSMGIAPAPQPATNGPDGAIAVLDSPLVVKTGSAVLEVADIDTTLLRARSAVEALGGHVSASDRAGADGQQTASVTYGVPAAQFEAALDALHRLATRVSKETSSTNEVTGQVVDLGARIGNLRATEAALTAIMARATKISDVLDVENQLTQVRGQIEELTGEKTRLEDQAAMSTLTVTFEVPLIATVEAVKDWNPSSEVDHAAAALLGFGQGLGTLAIWLAIVGLPLLALLLIVGLPLAFLARRARRRRTIAASAPVA